MENQKELKDFTLFKGMSDITLNILMEETEHRYYKEGETVIEEGSLGEELYMIQSGSLEVLKAGNSGFFVITEMSQGTQFGEISFLDSSPRSATIQAKTDATVLILRKKAIMEHVSNEEVLSELYRNIGIMASERLRSRSSDYAGSLEKKIELLHEKNYLNRFFISLMGTFSIVLVLTSIISSVLSGINIYDREFSWFFLLLILLPVILFVMKSGEPWYRFGLTLNNWKRSFIEGLLFSMGGIPVVFAIMKIAGEFGWRIGDALSFPHITDITSLRNILFSLSCFIYSFANEFIARGVFQSSLYRAFSNEKGWKAIVYSSFMFALAHIPFGTMMVAVTLISGFFLGFLFLRHGSLIGVTIVHFLLGGFAMLLSGS